MTEMIEQARAILRRNDRGGYTVPTDRLYPFQWNWDSAFVAMGWATFDEARGFTEVERLLEGQWDDGLVPQIVFHAPSDDYFPGPSVWGVQHVPPTSGITQPPVLASAVRRLLDRGAQTARRPRSGWRRSTRDWSPRIAGGSGARSGGQRIGVDAASLGDGHGQQPCLGRGAGARADRPRPRRCSGATLRTSMPSMRPRAEEYQRFIHLVDLFRDAGWQPDKMLAASPFRVADIATNAILLRAERDLLVLARRFGGPGEAAEIAGRADRMQDAIGRLWNGRAGPVPVVGPDQRCADRGGDVRRAAAAVCRGGRRGAHAGNGRDVAALG